MARIQLQIEEGQLPYTIHEKSILSALVLPVFATWGI